MTEVEAKTPEVSYRLSHSTPCHVITHDSLGQESFHSVSIAYIVETFSLCLIPKVASENAPAVEKPTTEEADKEVKPVSPFVMHLVVQ